MTTAPPTPAADNVQPTVLSRNPRTRATWDIIVTVVLLVLGLGIALLGSFLGLMLAFVSDSCGSSTTCDTNQIGLGITVAAIGVWPPMLIAIVLSIVFLVVRLRAFWIPIVAIVLMAAVWAIGLSITLSAISPTPPL
jgi:hypothetical protein